MARQTLERRFWSKVDKRGADECWPWTGCRDQKGYGMFRIDRETVTRAGRYVVGLGRISVTGRPDPRIAMHSCDNPPCCNPAHIRIGTVAENNRDRADKGRSASIRGSANNLARYSEGEITQLLRVDRFETRKSLLAALYGLSSFSYLWQIRTGKAWAHVEGRAS